MEVPAINASVQKPQVSAENRSLSSLNYDAFLKLLVAEMQNQDPTQPVDTSQYMSQLASFATVEQGIQSNARLDQIISSLALSQSTGIVGKTVTSADGSISGVVDSIQVLSDNIRAVLHNGSTLLLGPGVIVSQP